MLTNGSGKKETISIALCVEKLLTTLSHVFYEFSSHCKYQKLISVFVFFGYNSIAVLHGMFG